MAIDVYLTSACNLRCRYCFKLDSDDAPRIPLDDVCAVLTAGYAQNHRYVSFSGGEPFIYKPIFDVLDHAHGLGYWISILSHGGLLDRAMVQRLKKYWRVRVRISLDGANPEQNDFLRDRGSFDRALAAIALLVENGIDTGIGVTVSEHNIDSLDAMLQLCLDNGVSFARFVPVMRAKHGKAAHVTEALHERLLESLVAFSLAHPDLVDLPRSTNKKQSPSIDSVATRRCLAGKEFFALTADRKLVPCGLIEDHEEIPSVPYTGPESFAELGTKMDALFDRIQPALAGICSTCDFREVCVGGCLAEKISFDRSLDAEQPICTKLILEGLATKFERSAFDALVESWVWQIQNSLEPNAKRACMRQAPYWNVNFARRSGWSTTALRFN
jgi:radical SAM protein with 4Fe4S-binding SPASM domain